MEKDYSRLVMLCRDKKLDFDITCSCKENKQFILNLMGCVPRIFINGVEYYLGSKYQVLMYNLKEKVGKANFNNKQYYKAIQSFMREFE